MRISVLCAAALSLCGVAASARAATFNFGSTNPGFASFVSDNDIRLFPFTVTDPFARLDLLTTGYAAGGFDPSLAVYTDTGNAATDLLVVGSLSTDLDNAGGLYDDAVSVIVPAGNYLVALTQYDNTATDTDSDGVITRADGFTFNNALFSLPDYTNPGATPIFVNLDGVARSGAYAATLVTVAVPEAPSAALLLPALALLGVAIVRRNISKGI